MPARSSLPADRAGILQAAAQSGVFTDEEMQVVGELFDDYLPFNIATLTYFLSYHAGEQVLGFACWGPTDLTRNTADLYWICTAPQAQGRGVGSALFHAVEDAVRAMDRRIIIIWTSSRPEYEAARQLYRRVGCEISAQIRGFFDDDDDLCLYTRHLT